MVQKLQIITFLGACYGTNILGSSPGRRTNQKKSAMGVADFLYNSTTKPSRGCM